MKGASGVRFFGNVTNTSGYGIATLNFAKAFSRSSIPTQFYITGDKNLVSNFSKIPVKADIDFYLHVPPFSFHKSSNYRIAYFYWEADTLPKSWAKDIKGSVDELWVPCELTRQAVLKSGFSGPIHTVFTPIEPGDISNIKIAMKSNSENILSDDVFKFYSIFQWNERKGYTELISAYLKEFNSNDNVILILKVNEIKYKSNGLSKIKSDILDIKRRIDEKNAPDILLITEHLKDDDLAGLHQLCDCFVLPHHGEGWGMPIHEAMMHSNKIITTKFGGITEYLDDDSAYIIPHSLVNVPKLNWTNLYDEYQKWAQPSVDSLMRLMRNCIGDELKKGIAAKKIADKYSIDLLSNDIDKLLSVGRSK